MKVNLCSLLKFNNIGIRIAMELYDHDGLVAGTHTNQQEKFFFPEKFPRPVVEPEEKNVDW